MLGGVHLAENLASALALASHEADASHMALGGSKSPSHLPSHLASALAMNSHEALALPSPIAIAGLYLHEPLHWALQSRAAIPLTEQVPLHMPSHLPPHEPSAFLNEQLPVHSPLQVASQAVATSSLVS